MIQEIKFEDFIPFGEFRMKFASQINVLIGPSGVGKTTILRSVSALHRLHHWRGQFPRNLVRYGFDCELGSIEQRFVFPTTTSARVSTTVKGETAPRMLTIYSKPPASLDVIGSDAAAQDVMPVVDIPTPTPQLEQMDIPMRDPEGPKLPKSDRVELQAAISLAVGLTFELTGVGGLWPGVCARPRMPKAADLIPHQMLSAGVQKVASLWLALEQGLLVPGSILCLDSLESDTEPRLLAKWMEWLLRLSQLGVQIFVSTHSYIVCKALDQLQTQFGHADDVLYHALYRDEETGRIMSSQEGDYVELTPNHIADEFARLYDVEIGLSLGVEIGGKCDGY